MSPRKTPEPSEALTLGDRLRALRDERGLTLKEMEDACGISFTYLSEIERNNVCPSVDTIKHLASFFNVSVNLLVNNRINTSLPVKLQYARKLRGFSQKELAAKAGVSAGLIAQLELAKVNASLKTVEKLAEALNVSVCYLIMDRQDIDGIMGAISSNLRMMLQDPKVQTIIGSICTMDDTELKLVLNFINMVKNPTFY